MIQGATLYQRRIVIGAAICAAAFAIVVAQLVYVTLLRGGIARAGAAHIVAARADLTDRNGQLLARDLPVQDLYARPHNFWDKAQAAHDLSLATGASEDRLLRGFNGKSPYVLVARQLTPDVQEKVMRLGLPGLEFEQGAKRYYTNGRATAQLLGMTDPDGNGVSGLEKGLNTNLQAASEETVATSIDMRVQYILDAEVGASLQMFRAKAAGGVVMDVKSGEILGLVSLPDYDPNQRSFAPADSARNIMTQDVYELGSVFKVFTMTLSLEDGTARPDEVFSIGNVLQIGRFPIHEAEKMPATLTMRDILAQSSNIGSAQIALRSGGDRQRGFLTSLGLLSPRLSEMPEIARPLYPRNWGTIETATVGFGHGIAVSPLSYVAAAAIVVNGGRRITPTFIKAPGDARGEQIIKPETSKKMLELLRYVVTNGTGRKADIPGYNVGGKTGSAEKPGPHGYQAHALVTSFFATFPVEDPRYIVFVMLDEPHGTKETFGFALAGYTAAPMAGRIISRIAPLLGVPNRAPPVTLAQTGL